MRVERILWYVTYALCVVCVLDLAGPRVVSRVAVCVLKSVRGSVAAPVTARSNAIT